MHSVVHIQQPKSPLNVSSKLVVLQSLQSESIIELTVRGQMKCSDGKVTHWSKTTSQSCACIPKPQCTLGRIILKQSRFPSTIKISNLLLVGLDRTISVQADATRWGIMKLLSSQYKNFISGPRMGQVCTSPVEAEYTTFSNDKHRTLKLQKKRFFRATGKGWNACKG